MEIRKSAHTHCCKCIKNKAISKQYLIYSNFFIHIKLKNDQKYLCEAFHSQNIKKETSSLKNIAISSFRQKGGSIVQGEEFRLWSNSVTVFNSYTEPVWLGQIMSALN